MDPFEFNRIVPSWSAIAWVLALLAVAVGVLLLAVVA